jgi:hypothetical protein
LTRLGIGAANNHIVGMATRNRIERIRRAWPLPPLAPRDVIGVLILIVLLFLFFLFKILEPEVIRRINYGFGPEWDCANPGKISGLNCIKRLQGSSPK